MKNKKTGFTLLIVGCVLSMQNAYLKSTGIIKPSSGWDWKYDSFAMLSVLGTILAIIGLIIVLKATRKAKENINNK